MAIGKAPITFHVERVTGDRWDVVAKVRLASCPNQVMAEVIASGVADLNIPIVRATRLPDPRKYLAAKEVERKAKAWKERPGRKPRADKGVKRGPKKKAKSRRS